MQSCNTCHVAYINPAYKASQERIRAARERLATLELDRSMQIPEVHPPGPPAGAYIIPQYIYIYIPGIWTRTVCRAGAPYTARQDGRFVAGTDQKPLTQELLEKAVSVESST